MMGRWTGGTAGQSSRMKYIVTLIGVRGPRNYKTRMRIDLNSDLAEGAGHDEEILGLVSSANLSCGAHAGDDEVLRSALGWAKERGVTVGAHPGYADREHFGRRELDLHETAIHELCVTQVNYLREVAATFGIEVRYLKPHGALYNQACRDERVARPIVEAARS